MRRWRMESDAADRSSRRVPAAVLLARRIEVAEGRALEKLDEAGEPPRRFRQQPFEVVDGDARPSSRRMHPLPGSPQARPPARRVCARTVWQKRASCAIC